MFASTIINGPLMINNLGGERYATDDLIFVQ